MRTKLFIVLFCAMILVVMLCAPAKHVLTDLGILQSENVGNIIEVDKVYHEDAFGAAFFNGIEQVKRQINDTYINYMPFYMDITKAAKKTQRQINRPVSDYLGKTGSAVEKERRAQAELDELIEQLLKDYQAGEGVFAVPDETVPTPPASDTPDTAVPDTAPIAPPETEPVTEPVIDAETDPADTTPATPSETDPVSPPATEPPVTAPVTDPPATTPVTAPPATEPPATQPVTPPAPSVNIPTESVLKDDPYFEYMSNDGQHRYYLAEILVESQDAPIEFLVRVPGAEGKKMKSKLDAQVTKLNDLAAAAPHVNLYVYAATSFEDTALCDEWLPSESKIDLFEDFFQCLDPSIQAGHIEIRSFEEYAYKHFLTDHHWNVNGYLEAYRDITAMFAENYSGIKEMTPTLHTISGLKFYGSNCRLAGTFDLYDPLTVAEFPLAAHDLVIEDGVPYGSRNDFATNLKKYKAGDYQTIQGYDHYIEFFRIPKKITYPGNNTGRKLLVVGDSYSPPILEALASYFDVTYVHYVGSNSKLQTINYTSYIKDNGITDVLILEMSSRVVYDYYDDSLLNINN